jgi:hypothetical protein
MTVKRPNSFTSKARNIDYEHPASKLLGAPVSMFYEHGSLTADTTVKLFAAVSEFLLESARYINPTGLAADAANYFNIKLVETAVVMANWSTETGQEGTIAADTFVDLTLGTAADRTLAADEELSIFFDETGTATLPAGRIQIEGRYYETNTALVKLFKAKERFLVEKVRYINPTGLVEDATNFFDIQVKNGATVVANWSTETTVGEGTIAADTWVDLTLSTTGSDLVLALDDVLSLNLDENGTQTLPAGRIQIEGRYL